MAAAEGPSVKYRMYFNQKNDPYLAITERSHVMVYICNPKKFWFDKWRTDIERLNEGAFVATWFIETQNNGFKQHIDGIDLARPIVID